MENWKPVPIPEYSSLYLVSDLGSVRRVIPTRYSGFKNSPLRPGSRRGYLYVVLCRGGSRRLFSLHRLVALAFIGPEPEGNPIVMHIDDDKTNCAATNLRWGTHSENSADMVKKGRSLKGLRNHKAKLTEAHVAEIRELYRPGVSQQFLADRYGITQTTVSKIVRGVYWSHITIRSR